MKQFLIIFVLHFGLEIFFTFSSNENLKLQKNATRSVAEDVKHREVSYAKKLSSLYK